MGVVIALIVAGGATAAAADPAVEDGLVLALPVEGPVAPMPIPVAVMRRAGGTWVPVGPVRVEASAGEVEMAAEEGALVARGIYVPDASEPPEATDVRLVANAGAESAEAVLRIDPAVAGRVAVEVSPERLVKTAEAEAVVTVRTLDAEGQPAPGRRPRLTVNVGSLGPLEPGEAPGTWTARYTPGPARYPEVAVFAAFAPWPHADSPALASGHATLPLSASIDLPGEVRPRVQTTVEIAGEVFGPVTSDRRGRFEVPVVVPPGHGTALGVSLDRFGNRRETEIDLRLPPTNRITGAVHPTRLVADGEARARVVVLAVDVFGRPSSDATPRIVAEQGEVGDLVHHGDGVFETWYRAPRGIAGGAAAADRITVDLPGDARSREALTVDLVSGAPARITHALEPAVVPAPADAPARLALSVVDAAGTQVTGAELALEVRRGRLERREEDGALETRFDYHPPGTAEGWSDAATVRTTLGPGDVPAAVAWDPSAEALAVVDGTGRPVPGAVATVGGERRTADETGRLGRMPSDGAVDVHLDGVALPLRIHVGRDADGRRVGFPAARLAQTARLELPLMVPVPVDVEVTVAAEDGRLRLSWRVTGGEGERAISVRAGRDEIARHRGRDGEIAVEVDPGTALMVVDVDTGISAVVLSPPAEP